MPHSTGGGGSHGGSHSSSSSGSSGSSVRYYHDYRPGRHVWVTYRNGMPRYRYTDCYYHKTNYLTLVLFAAVFIALGVFLLYNGLPPAKVTTGQTPLVIEDDADIFDSAEEDELKTAVSQYYDKAGIPVVIKTIDFDTWDDAHGRWGGTQEKYAYDTYVGMFRHDETKWLICIWNGEKNSTTAGIDSDAYTFEGIAGDDTSRMLPEDITNEFNSTVSSSLSRNIHTSGASAQAFVEGFDNLRPAGTDMAVILMSLFWLSISGLVFFGALAQIIKDKKTPEKYKEHEVNTHGEPRLVTCKYCGGTYVFGEIKCPHCGAPGRTVYKRGDGSNG